MIDEDWEVAKSFFPKNWRWLAGRTKALKGLRKDKDPEQVLRAILIHLGCGHSLRETSVRIRHSGVSDLSDVSLMKRMRKSRDWLQALCESMVKRSAKEQKRRHGREFRLFDSTCIKEPGATGSVWRIHYSLRVPSLRCDFVRLTPAKGKGSGDSFLAYPAAAGDYIIADRGYSQAAGIHHLAASGARVCVRVNSTALPLQDADGVAFDLLGALGKNLKRAGTAGCWPVWVPGADGSRVAGRICAIRKSAEAIRLARKKLRRRASKKGQVLKPETLQYARYIILFTTFPEDDYTAAEVLDGYRYRWQIELVFKRFKQLAQLGHLPKTDPASVEAWLYGKLFITLLTQAMIDHATSFSPWGYDLDRLQQSQPLA